jgi:hypothetical protein
MSNQGNLKMMRMRVEALPRKELDALVMRIVEALYPGGDMEHEWSSDTPEDVASALHPLRSW